MRRAALAVFLLATPAAAETLSFQVDDSILVVRGVQSGSYANYEIIAEGSDPFQCIALDAQGKPLAANMTYAAMGMAIFEDLQVSDVDRVVCRRVK